MIGMALRIIGLPRKKLKPGQKPCERAQNWIDIVSRPALNENDARLFMTLVIIWN
jgi:hypothetical protein